MSKTSDLLSKYLQDIFFREPEAALDLGELDEDYVPFGNGLVFFAKCFKEYNDLVKALAAGDLNAPFLGRDNDLASDLNSLYSRLRHLAWQTQQVAKGDYTQRIDFMGDFAESFNIMVQQLAERQGQLLEEIEVINRKSKALEQSNDLLSGITKNIPQQILVLARDGREILFMNDMAKFTIEKDKKFLARLKNIYSFGNVGDQRETEFNYTSNGYEHHFSVNNYFIEWGGTDAEAFLIIDVTDDKNKIKELRNAVLQTMSDLVGERDIITGAHIERTQHYLRVLIDGLVASGLYNEEVSKWNIENVIQSAQLHDVGKIAVPDSILNKPAKFTDEEFDIIKQHTTFGERLIGKVQLNTTENEFLTYAKVFAISHHEKWNGRGYPYGLAGEEIPLLGRVMAIADVYDALVSERTYKKAFTHEEAVNIIVKDKSVHFDPSLVDLFLTVESKFEEITMSYKEGRFDA